MSSREFRIIVVLLGLLSGCASRVELISEARNGPCSENEIGSIACGSYQFEVHGTVLFSDELERSLSQDLHIFSGFYIEGELIGELQRVEAVILESGEFSFEAGAGRSTREMCVDGNWETVDIHLEAYNLLRTDGCRDQIVISSKDASEHNVTMDCGK
jgi:hypothetical protein